MSLAIDHLNQLASRHGTPDAGGGGATESLGLWVPGEPVLVFRLELPKVSRRKQQEMLPWLLEDRLLSSPDDFEFILGAQVEEGLSLVYAIEKVMLGQWVLLAEAAAVSPARMVPDFLSLPYEDGRWTLYTDAGRLLVRTGLHEGFAANLDIGWQQLELLLGQREDSMRVSHLATAEVAVPENLQGRLDTETGKINWSFTELPVGLNLLPPAYRQKPARFLSAWIPAFATGILLLILSLSYMLVQSWAWQRDAKVLEKGLAQAYEALFSRKLPDRILDTTEAAQKHLKLLEHQHIVTQTSPLAEMTALDQVLSTCPDCMLMGMSQTDSGLNIQIGENPRLLTRLSGIDGWSIERETADSKDMTRLRMQRVGPGNLQ